MAVWYLYLLRCADKSLYCGITTDITRRLAQHNGERAGGAKCTRARRPVVLEACVPCADKSTALKQELLIKKLPREHKLSALLALTS
ncbi:MAG: GIY-YIG nuclease family protein [Desulfovibrionaceae bacterium]